jgi:hypothetical protein
LRRAALCFPQRKSALQAQQAKGLRHPANAAFVVGTTVVKHKPGKTVKWLHCSIGICPSMQAGDAHEQSVRARWWRIEMDRMTDFLSTNPGDFAR